jgi:thiol-disulfide isomerase/thioredoxin
MSLSPFRRTACPRGALALCVALVGALVGCSASNDSATGSKGYIAGDGRIVLIDESDRPPVPELSGTALGGGQFDSSKYSGAPMVINVWASWCGPCRAEADDLVRASKRLDDVQFFGINTQDEPSSAEAFVRAQGITYPSLLDEDGTELLEFYGLYNLKALPTTIVVDAEGRIAALVTDAVTEATLVGLVSDVTGEA